MKLMFVLLSFFVVSISSMSLQASGRNFVDLDGDGFNDNIIDFDNNNIPDEFQKNVKEIKSFTRTFTFAPLTLFSDKPETVKITASQQFALHQFKARILSKCRSDFDADFSSGQSVSSSSASSCAGGICY